MNLIEPILKIRLKLKMAREGVNVQIVLLSRPTGSISSGNLSIFDAISSKEREIARDNICCTSVLFPVTNGVSSESRIV